MPHRLNIFQKSMLQWNDLQAYNAVHVIQARGIVQEEGIRSAIASVLAGRGLGLLELNRLAGTYDYLSQPGTIELTVLQSLDKPADALEAEIESQLNTRFSAEGAFTPFRFFLCPDKDTFWLGLAYFHPAADAESVLILLKDILAAFEGRKDDLPGVPGELGTRTQPVLPSRNSGGFLRRFARVPHLIRVIRHSYRPRFRDPADMRNKFILFCMRSETLDGVKKTARSWDVTLNDVFLASLLKAIACVTPNRERATRRKGLSIGCIVNTRKDAGIAGSRTFGLFLGFFTVHHKVPSGIGLSSLAKDVRSQTSAVKRNRLYLGGGLELRLAQFLISRSSPKHRQTFYQKNYPLWGGISNMDLNFYWSQAGDNPPVDYFRAVSTGPVTPLVLSISTIGSNTNVGLSYRSTVYSAEQVEQIRNSFLQELNDHANKS
jgi:hypothetical protein